MRGGRPSLGASARAPAPSKSLFDFKTVAIGLGLSVSLLGLLYYRYAGRAQLVLSRAKKIKRGVGCKTCLQPLYTQEALNAAAIEEMTASELAQIPPEKITEAHLHRAFELLPLNEEGAVHLEMQGSEIENTAAMTELNNLFRVLTAFSEWVIVVPANGTALLAFTDEQCFELFVMTHPKPRPQASKVSGADLGAILGSGYFPASLSRTRRPIQHFVINYVDEQIREQVMSEGMELVPSLVFPAATFASVGLVATAQNFEALLTNFADTEPAKAFRLIPRQAMVHVCDAPPAKSDVAGAKPPSVLVVSFVKDCISSRSMPLAELFPTALASDSSVLFKGTRSQKAPVPGEPFVMDAAAIRTLLSDPVFSMNPGLPSALAGGPPPLLRQPSADEEEAAAMRDLQRILGITPMGLDERMGADAKSDLERLSTADPQQQLAILAKLLGGKVEEADLDHDLPIGENDYEYGTHGDEFDPRLVAEELDLEDEEDEEGDEFDDYEGEDEGDSEVDAELAEDLAEALLAAFEQRGRGGRRARHSAEEEEAVGQFSLDQKFREAEAARGQPAQRGEEGAGVRARKPRRGRKASSGEAQLEVID